MCIVECKKEMEMGNLFWWNLFKLGLRGYERAIFSRPVVDGLPTGKPVSGDLVVVLAGGVEPLELPEQMLTLNIRSVVY